MDPAVIAELRARAHHCHSFVDECLDLLEQQSVDLLAQTSRCSQLEVKIDLTQSHVQQLTRERDELRTELETLQGECRELRECNGQLLEQSQLEKSKVFESNSSQQLDALGRELESCRHELAATRKEHQLLNLQLEQALAEHNSAIQGTAITVNRARLLSAT